MHRRLICTTIIGAEVRRKGDHFGIIGVPIIYYLTPITE